MSTKAQAKSFSCRCTQACHPEIMHFWAARSDHVHGICDLHTMNIAHTPPAGRRKKQMLHVTKRLQTLIKNGSYGFPAINIFPEIRDM